MEIKKYRAATTREALEKIKSELGEDAFVLETKQVRAGGILGFGSGMQVEVSAAAPQPKRKTQEEKSAARNIFDFTDDEPAVPLFLQNAEKTRRPEILPALAVRAAAAVPSETNNAVMKPQFKQLETIKEVVEISTEAPRIVHAKKETAPLAKKPVVSSPAEPAAASPVAEIAPSQPQQQALNYEIERLRAEMREVKFTLGAFAAKQSGFAGQTDSVYEAPAEIYDSPYYEAYLELTSTGLSSKTAASVLSAIIAKGGKVTSDSQELAHQALANALPNLIGFSNDSRFNQEQTIIAMIGATGVGKTTTLAKIAARVALRERRRVEMVTLDTYRIAAVEQLKTYAEIIGAGCHVVRSVLELDATISRLPSDAVILIDTTGRSPHDLSDQFEFSDYLRRREDILKCLVLQATTQPLDALAAVQKFAMYGANCLALTKLDETTRPGAVIDVAAEANLPLFYLCAGQKVPEDLEQATAESLTAKVMRKQTVAAAI